MQAKDIMTTKVLVMKPDTKVTEAIGILVGNAISGAPVVNDKDVLLGVISEKDLLVSLDFIGKEKAAGIAIEEFMSKEVITFTEDSPVKNIMQELVRKNIKRVPIVRDNKVVGVVSRRDILRTFFNE